MSSKPIIQVKNLSVTYFAGESNEVRALESVNLEIYPGEFIIFLGPSGCGKSTLLYAIAGLETNIQGKIVVGNKDLTALSAKDIEYLHQKEIGMIFQAYYLISSLSVLDNVVLPQIFLGGKKKERRKNAMSLLEYFGVKNQATKLPTELSGGQQQRVAISRSLVNDPLILLADEPIGNLDSKSAADVMNLLKDLNKKHKKTIILVTHNPEYLESGDRVFHMKDGLVTKETVNREKHKIKKEPIAPTTELKRIMRAYQGLSPAQINVIIMPYKARLFAHHFVANRNMEEIKILESIIQRKLFGTISHKEFFNTLHKPYHEGGVGLNRQTAERIVRRIDRKIRMAYYVYKKGHQRKDAQGVHRKVTLEEKAHHVTYYLLKTCYNEYYHELNEATIARLEQAVAQRLLDQMSKVEFFKFLDQPFKDGGVGLNSRTVRAITEEIELILILGYGVMSKIASKKEFVSKDVELEKNKAAIIQRISHNT